MDKDKKLFKSFVREFFLYSQLQRDFLVSVRKNRAQVKTNLPPAQRRTRYLYRCASCGHHFSRKAVEVDHISPLSEADNTLPFVQWCQRIVELTFKKNNLQILCRSCHNLKTLDGKYSRKNFRGNVEG